MRSLKRMIFASAVVVTALAPAWAATVQITATKDNSLYESTTGDLSNGAGEHLFSGATVSFGVRRAVLAFDVAGSVPPGVTISDASLTLQMNKTISGAETMTIHRLLADWGEGASDASGQEGGGAPAAAGDATWIHTFSPSDLWLSPGGDFDPVASASTAVALNGPYTWTSPAMVADAQDWLDNPAGDFGWLLLGNESEIATAKRFDSREGAEPPVLTITYDDPDVVPATSPVGLTVLGLLLAAAAGVVHRIRAKRDC